ncbi:MAG: hypothetical protein A3H97_21330 [Acidobacteria bacterium RIFCSPLOWO2_02_FULL_65_29]|nr:MAG: hypothetical protein A3H97_21330 [Acidobacteria bacterium RIFCSPLOWO2_02_FULL_65_29]
MNMSRILRVVAAWAAIVGVGSPAFAGDLHASIASVVQQQAQPAQQTPVDQRTMPKAYFWPGAGLFVGGMAVAINGFLNNKNGEFPEFGEAESTNVEIGAAGLAAAFGGGVLLFLGKQKAGRAPSVAFGPGRVAVAQHVTW